VRASEKKICFSPRDCSIKAVQIAVDEQFTRLELAGIDIFNVLNTVRVITIYRSLTDFGATEIAGVDSVVRAKSRGDNARMDKSAQRSRDGHYESGQRGAKKQGWTIHDLYMLKIVACLSYILLLFLI